MSFSPATAFREGEELGREAVHGAMAKAKELKARTPQTHARGCCPAHKGWIPREGGAHVGAAGGPAGVAPAPPNARGPTHRARRPPQPLLAAQNVSFSGALGKGSELTGELAGGVKKQARKLKCAAGAGRRAGLGAGVAVVWAPRCTSPEPCPV